MNASAARKVDLVFGALVDRTRRDLLRSVVERGPVSASALASDATITRQAVSKHLSVLGAAGLVTTARSGREVNYSAELGPLEAIDGWISETGSAWDRRLGRLGELLDG